MLKQGTSNDQYAIHFSTQTLIKNKDSNVIVSSMIRLGLTFELKNLLN